MDPDSTGEFRYPEFLLLMTQKSRDMDAEDEIMEAFKVILLPQKKERERGSVSETELITER